MVLTGHEKEKDGLRGDTKVPMRGQVSKLYERQNAEAKLSSKESLTTNMTVWMRWEPNLS